jgi:hypothetical protein
VKTWALEKGGAVVGVWILVGAVIAIAVVFAVQNALMRRRGYAIPGRTVVRCSGGHLFTTTWVEGGSLKAVRLGPTTRYQRCPVGQHWAIVHPVRDGELTEEERRTLSPADETERA